MHCCCCWGVRRTAGVLVPFQLLILPDLSKALQHGPVQGSSMATNEPCELH